MQRRKTLLNSLGGLGFLSKDQIREALQAANIDEKRRGEYKKKTKKFVQIGKCEVKDSCQNNRKLRFFLIA